MKVGFMDEFSDRSHLYKLYEIPPTIAEVDEDEPVAKPKELFPDEGPKAPIIPHFEDADFGKRAEELLSDAHRPLNIAELQELRLQARPWGSAQAVKGEEAQYRRISLRIDNQLLTLALTDKTQRRAGEPVDDHNTIAGVFLDDLLNGIERGLTAENAEVVSGVVDRWNARNAPGLFSFLNKPDGEQAENAQKLSRALNSVRMSNLEAMPTDKIEEKYVRPYKLSLETERLARTAVNNLAALNDYGDMFEGKYQTSVKELGAALAKEKKLNGGEFEELPMYQAIASIAQGEGSIDAAQFLTDLRTAAL